MNRRLPEIREGWHRHARGGGWVQETATVAETAWIDVDAEVAGCASVEGHAWIADRARVRDHARVAGHTTVAGQARVEGHARIGGNAWIAADSWISDHAQVSGNAWIQGNIWIGGRARVEDNARVTDNVWISGEALIAGHAWVAGTAWIEGAALVVANEHYLHMLMLGYKATAWLTKANQIEVRYGCEMYLLDDWPQLLPNFCERYEPARAAQYEAAVRGFLEAARHSITR